MVKKDESGVVKITIKRSSSDFTSSVGGRVSPFRMTLSPLALLAYHVQ